MVDHVGKKHTDVSESGRRRALLGCVVTHQESVKLADATRRKRVMNLARCCERRARIRERQEAEEAGARRRRRCGHCGAPPFGTHVAAAPQSPGDAAPSE